MGSHKLGDWHGGESGVLQRTRRGPSGGKLKKLANINLQMSEKDLPWEGMAMSRIGKKGGWGVQWGGATYVGEAEKAQKVHGSL